MRCREFNACKAVLFGYSVPTTFKWKSSYLIINWLVPGGWQTFYYKFSIFISKIINSHLHISLTSHSIGFYFEWWSLWQFVQFLRHSFMNIDEFAHIPQCFYEAKCQITRNDVIKLTENYIDWLPVWSTKVWLYTDIFVCMHVWWTELTMYIREPWTTNYSDGFAQCHSTTHWLVFW